MGVLRRDLQHGGRIFEDFMLGVVQALVSAADRIYLLSGHGGNMSFR
jgi:creatinine amidohydrolase/Fe(II)-dependent formamide hydrolase-like protein